MIVLDNSLAAGPSANRYGIWSKSKYSAHKHLAAKLVLYQVVLSLHLTCWQKPLFYEQLKPRASNHS